MSQGANGDLGQGVPCIIMSECDPLSWKPASLDHLVSKVASEEVHLQCVILNKPKP